jgi:hypothetical protein
MWFLTLLPKISSEIIEEEQMKINDKKGMFSKAIEDSAYKGTLQLHVEGVGDGVAPR